MKRHAAFAAVIVAIYALGFLAARWDRVSHGGCSVGPMSEWSASAAPVPVREWSCKDTCDDDSAHCRSMCHDTDCAKACDRAYAGCYCERCGDCASPRTLPGVGGAQFRDYVCPKCGKHTTCAGSPGTSRVTSHNRPDGTPCLLGSGNPC